MKKFYFTNPTFDRHKAQEIRMRIEKEANIELVSPFYDKAGTPTAEIAKLDKGQKPEGISSGEIFQTDMNLVRQLDGIVAYITRKTSWGSITEIVYAWTLGKKVYLIFDPNSQGNCDICGTFNNNAPKHPFPKELKTRQFGSVDAFIEFAKKEFSGDHS